MPAAISRWSMAYFFTSLAFLVGGLGLMSLGFGFPDAPLGSPDTLVIVHILALGWLGLLFSGALLQFVPVLAGSDLRRPDIAAPALLCIIAGLICLMAGFLSLGGHIGLDLRVLSLGAILLVLGFGSLAGALVSTLMARKPAGLPARLVLTGFFTFFVAALLGLLFASELSGLLNVPWAADLLATGIPFHAALGILGWMTLTALGVSYRLFSMFMLAPDLEYRKKPILWLVFTAIGVLLLALSLAAYNSQLVPYAIVIALLITVLIAGLYIGDVLTMYRMRRRPQLELNTLASLAALLFLVAGLIALGAAQLADAPDSIAAVAYYLLAMGWLTGLGLAQLYKIVPFLTWLEAYGPIMGRTAVPRVQDLVNEKLARYLFVIYYALVAAGTISLFLISTPVFRVVSLCQGVVVLALAREYVRARRLYYAPEAIRLPSGAIRPSFIFASRRERKNA